MSTGKDVDPARLAAGYVVGVPLALAAGWVTYRVLLWVAEPLTTYEAVVIAARTLAVAAVLAAWRWLGPILASVTTKDEDA